VTISAGSVCFLFGDVEIDPTTPDPLGSSTLFAKSASGAVVRNVLRVEFYHRTRGDVLAPILRRSDDGF